MKTFKSLLLGIFLICLCLFLGAETSQAEVTYLGELCAFAFESNCTLGPPCAAINLKIGVLLYGDGHYVLDGSANTSPVYGTAVIQDNMASISLNRTSPTTSSAIHIVVDLNTGTGTYTDMPTFPVLTPPATSGLTLSLTAGKCQQ